MESMFTYTDYREYLRDALKEKQAKNSSFSYRAAASKIGIGSGSLTRILNGSRHPGYELLPKITAFLGLKKRETEYLGLLVQFETCKDEECRRTCYQELLRIRAERNVPVPEENHQFFEKWYNVALFELLRTGMFTDGDPSIGTQLEPPLTASKTRKALGLLKKLGYASVNKDGVLVASQPFLTTGKQWEGVAIHGFQVEMAKLGERALDKIPKDDRDCSTLTMALSEKCFSKVREVIEKARREIAEIEHSCSQPDRVFTMNFQCFPLSVRKGTGGCNEK